MLYTILGKGKTMNGSYDPLYIAVFVLVIVLIVVLVQRTR